VAQPSLRSRCSSRAVRSAPMRGSAGTLAPSSVAPDQRSPKRHDEALERTDEGRGDRQHGAEVA
jgi:hypothetical protein